MAGNHSSAEWQKNMASIDKSYGIHEMTSYWSIDCLYVFYAVSTIFKPCNGGENDKRPMDHIAHMKNQFKSLNTFEQSYDYLSIYIYHKIGPEVQEKIFIIKKMGEFGGQNAHSTLNTDC